MKWAITLFTLFMTSVVYADSNTPKIIALNEPDQLFEQRQAAVERLKKLLEQKRAGIKPTSEAPVPVKKPSITNQVVEGKSKPVPNTRKLEAVAQPPKDVKLTKVVKSNEIVKAKQAALQKKKIVVAAWGDNLSNSVNGDNTSIPSYSRKFASVMKNVVNSSKTGTVVRVLSWQTAKQVNFSTDDVGLSRRLCSGNQADILLFGILEAGEAGGARRHPDTTFMKFDCSLGKMEYFTTSMDQHINDPRGFMFKTTLREKFTTFISEEVKL